LKKSWNIEALVNWRIAELEPDVKLDQWIETVPNSLLRKFVSSGLIDGRPAEIATRRFQDSEWPKVEIDNRQSQIINRIAPRGFEPLLPG
jgi:hypothetical protein